MSDEPSGTTPLDKLATLEVRQTELENKMVEVMGRRNEPEGDIPAEVAAAMVQVEAGILKLGHDGENKYSNYNYSSIDAFYALVGPLCAEAGVICKPRQVGDPRKETLKRQGGKEETVLIYSFVMQWIHESGKSWLDHNDKQDVPMPYNGAQTAGQARSYAHKYYLRATFQIPTGDPDPESQAMPTSEDSFGDIGPAVQSKKSAPKKTSPPKDEPSVTFFMAGSVDTKVPIKNVVTQVKKLLKGKDNATRNQWMESNNIGMTELMWQDKSKWLEIKKIVEDGVENNEGELL